MKLLNSLRKMANGENINFDIGIAIQNFLEGLAVSLPLHAAGFSKWQSFWYGQLSGIVQPVFGILGAVAVSVLQPILPSALSFAAGAFIYFFHNDIIPGSNTSGNDDKRQKAAAKRRELLLSQLRQTLEAMLTLVHYLADTLDAFSTPRLKKELEIIKTELMKTKLDLEEVRVSYRQLEASNLPIVEQLETTHSAELAGIRDQHDQEMARIMGQYELQLLELENKMEEYAKAGRTKLQQDEMESLRSVLDLRNKEMQQLRIRNDSQLIHLEELPVMQQKAKFLQARIEDLEMQVQNKTSLERKLSHENKLLQQSYQHELQQTTQLKCSNRFLQWSLELKSDGDQHRHLVTNSYTQLTDNDTVGSHITSSEGSSPPSLLPSSLPQPKDSEGEAMESEETLEDEGDLNNGSSSCSEE